MIFVRNLLRRKLRSLLALLGMSIGMALFVSIATMSLDIVEEIKPFTATYNTEIMIQSFSRASGFNRSLGFNRILGVNRPVPLTSAQLDAIRSHLNVVVDPLIRGEIRLPEHGSVSVLGIPENLVSLLPILQGRVHDPAKAEVMVGVLGRQRLQIVPGDEIVIKGEAYLVSGVFRNGSPYLDGSLVTSLQFARKLLEYDAGETHVSAAMIRTGSAEETEQLLEEIRESFPRLRARSSLEVYGIQQFLKTIEIFAWSIAIVSLLGVALTLANNLFISVTDRSREIGILMAIGWSPSHILRPFFLETLTLCWLGAIFGNLMAWLLLQQVAGFGGSALKIALPSFPAWEAILVSFLLAPFLSLLAMIYPAIAVFRMQPIQVIRHD